MPPVVMAKHPWITILNHECIHYPCPPKEVYEKTVTLNADDPNRCAFHQQQQVDPFLHGRLSNWSLEEDVQSQERNCVGEETIRKYGLENKSLTEDVEKSESFLRGQSAGNSFGRKKSKVKKTRQIYSGSVEQNVELLAVTRFRGSGEYAGSLSFGRDGG